MGFSKVSLSELVVWAVKISCLQTKPKTFDTLDFPSMFKEGVGFAQEVEQVDV